MTGLVLFAVFVAARVAVVWGRPLEWTPALALVSVSQDAAVAALFLGIERLVRPLRLGRAVTTGFFWAAVVYTALNVVVARAVSTPLTWPMLRAAGGPISDSIRFYLNGSSLLVMAAVVASAFAGLGALKRVPTRVQAALTMALVAVAVAGLFVARRVDARGYERNAVATLFASSLPAVEARTADRDWREPPFGADPVPRLSELRGTGAGRNVVVIGLESTGAQYLRTFGAREAVMPRLDALAESAVVFDRAYAVSPDSIRSLLSVLCSRYPAFDTRSDAYAQTTCASIADSFRAAGYRTAMFHSGRFGYLGMESVIQNRGFELLEDAGDIGGNRESSFGVDEPATVARILRWVDGLAPGERFFVNYLPIAGHHPYEAPAPGAFGSATDLDRYRSALHDGDRSLGTLLDGLRARGLYDNTVFVVYGDHGQAFGQHDGNFGHTFFLYEENVRVPLLMAMPGVLRAPARSDGVVSLVDLAPTLADIAGLAPDSRRQGRSALGGEPRMALFFTDYGSNLAGLRDGRWKFIHELGSTRSSLFDLNADPAERANVAAQQAERVAAYGRRLAEWSAAEKAMFVPQGEAQARLLRTEGAVSLDGRPAEASALPATLPDGVRIQTAEGRAVVALKRGGALAVGPKTTATIHANGVYNYNRIELLAGSAVLVSASSAALLNCSTDVKMSTAGIFRFDVLDPDRTDGSPRCRLRVHEGAASTTGPTVTYVLRPGEEMVLSKRAGDMIPVGPIEQAALDDFDRWSRAQAATAR